VIYCLLRFGAGLLSEGFRVEHDDFVRLVARRFNYRIAALALFVAGVASMASGYWLGSLWLTGSALAWVGFWWLAAKADRLDKQIRAELDSN
jgi:hypothetical protein